MEIALYVMYVKWNQNAKNPEPKSGDLGRTDKLRGELNSDAGIAKFLCRFAAFIYTYQGQLYL
jgi:hypothetical protein